MVMNGLCVILLYLFPTAYSKIGGGDFRLIYRHYATLYFVFCVDTAESELGILDLIQVDFISFWYHSYVYPFTYMYTQYECSSYMYV